MRDNSPYFEPPIDAEREPPFDPGADCDSCGAPGPHKRDNGFYICGNCEGQYD